jgi:hypothetical protein
VRELARRQTGVISAAQALGLGMTRSSIAWHRRSGRWRDLLAGVYLVETVGVPLHWAALSFTTRLRAALLAHGPASTAVLATAAEVHGFPAQPHGDGTIHLCLGPGRPRHQQPGVRLYTRDIAPDQVVSVSCGSEEVRATSVVRTAADLLRSQPRWDAVSTLDGLLNRRQLVPEELAAVEVLLHRGRGAVAARRYLDECDARAESALETRIRLIATDAGLPPDALQYEVRGRSGVLLGRGDLAWHRGDGRTLIAEGDGRSWHEAPHALYRDRHRANDLTVTGWIDVVRFTWADTRHPPYVPNVLRRHLFPP